MVATLILQIRKLSLREVEELTLDHNIQARVLPGTQKMLKNTKGPGQRTNCKACGHLFDETLNIQRDNGQIMSKNRTCICNPQQPACVLAKSLQSCLTLCDPVDCSPLSSSVHGILQAKYWSGLPCPSPGNVPNPGIQLESLKSPALAGGFFTTRATWKAPANQSRKPNDCRNQPQMAGT